MNEEDNVELNNESDELSNENLPQTQETSSMSKSSDESTSKKVQEALSKTVTKNSGAKSLIKTLLPILTWVLVFAIILIIIIGIVLFFITMPGMVMSKLKSLSLKIGSKLSAFFGGDKTKQIEDKQIYDVLDYLEQMGYDLKGYGFLTESIEGEQDGVKRYNEEDAEKAGKLEGDIQEAKSDFIYTYLVSDNYTYTIANGNQTNDLANNGHRILGAIFAVFQKVGNLFSDGQLGQYWGRGMISVYHQKSLGVPGDYYGKFFDKLTGSAVKVKVNADSGKRILQIKDGWGSNIKEYNLEGWTGRYGMPIDFLLSIHIATMMPDLAYDMVESFDTQLVLLLTDDYVPYIAYVKDHWYRDIYFVEKEGQNFVDYDYDYEALVKERWTLYETYTEEDAGGDKSKIGEYKLYALNDDGTYKTDESGNYIIMTQEEAEKENIKVAKKAVTIKNNDGSEYSDIRWNLTDGKWSAYKYDNDGTLVQTGEGLRTETNPEIKKMFLQNEYFRYDGSSETADKIEKLRKAINNGSDKLYYGPVKGIGPDGNEVDHTNISVSIDDEKSTDENNTVSIADLSGTVSLNQDSLNAFSMLENEHTLDADFMYRDFKELIVELGYFKKEELTDETPRLLEFLVPNIGSYMYPKRYIDKNEYEYGTMIHSKGDIDAGNLETIKEFTKTELVDGNEETQTEEEENPTAPEETEDQEGTDTQDDESQEIPDIPDTPEIPDEQDETGNQGDSFIEDGDTQTEEERDPTIPDEEYEEMEDSEYEIESETETQDISLSEQETSLEQIQNKSLSSLTQTVGSSYTSQYAGGSRTWTIDESVHGDGFIYGLELHGVTYRKYMQNKGYGSYAKKPFGSCNYVTSGCGPISSSIFSSGYGIYKNPLYYGHIYGCPPSLDGIKKGMESVGIEGEVYTIPRNYENTLSASAKALADRMQEALEEGKPIIVLVGEGKKIKGKNWQYTFGGHYFVLIGIDDNGKLIYVNTTSTTHEYVLRKDDFGKYETDNPIENFVYHFMQNSLKASRGVFIPDKAPLGLKTKGELYKGYLGNEEVVSPVTGILLEYSTYDEETDSITGEKYRTNVDLKYPANVFDTDNENQNSSGNNDSSQTAESPPNGENQVDKVGYAKILVLDTENYKKIESKLRSKSQWKNDDSFLNENGTYKDIDNLTTNQVRSKKWSDIDKTLYGYKEFAENYEEAGIAGYVVYIDGFKLELPDEDFDNENKEQLESKAPEGEEINLDTFKKTTLSSFNSKGNIKERKELNDSLFKKEIYYRMSSQKATDKLKAENIVKYYAAPSLYLDGFESENEDEKDMIIIKEGTVLGRTITDYELIVNYRNQKYEDFRKKQDYVKIGEVNKVIGNYLRIIIRDLDKTVVENAEDYMKLDENADIESLGNIEEFMYWQAMEPEGFHYDIKGVGNTVNQKDKKGNVYACRRSDASDKYGYDWAVCDGGADDLNLCPGIWLGEGSSGASIFKNVTGISNIVKYQTWCTGEQLLDIYYQELMQEVEYIQNNLKKVEPTEQQMFALIDVAYAGKGIMEEKGILKTVDSGKTPSKEEFINTLRGTSYWDMNPNGSKRRRMCDYYIYTENKYGVGVYNNKDKIDECYEFSSNTPFQDLMRNINSAKKVTFEHK